MSKNITQTSLEVLPFTNRISTLKMVLFDLLTLRLYSVIWFAKRYKTFNALNNNEKLKLTVAWLITLSLWCLCGWLVTFISFTDNSVIQGNPMRGWNEMLWIFQLIISYKMLKQIEIYAEEKYGKTLTHNPFAWFFFTVFYVNFAINNFQERLSKVIQENDKGENINENRVSV